jgi:TRAP transporter TAXI family solute receptor
MIGQLMQQVGVRDSVTAVYLGSKAPQALANGKIDAFNWSPGLGNATIHNTAAMLKIRILSLDDAARKSGFYKKYPYYGKIIIPGGLYAGVTEDVPTFGTGSILVANKKVSDELVHKVLTAIYSDAVRKEMSGAVGAASIKAMNKDSALNYITIPLHPGAEKYWKEQGKAIPADLASK